MPVILATDDFPAWRGEVPGDYGALRRPYPAAWLKAWKVSPRVGNLKTNDESLLEEV
jgi:putative SOS response-associated peptidase YedK